MLDAIGSAFVCLAAVLTVVATWEPRRPSAPRPAEPPVHPRP
jgi:hypothetical protein